MEERKYAIDRLFDQIIGPEPQYNHWDRELSADIIVCGGGIAGVCAARAAVEEGADVILFEKCEDVQGRSGAFGVINFPEANRWDRDFTQQRQEILAEMIKEGGNRGDYRILRHWAEHGGEDFAWYLNVMPELYKLEKTTDVPPEGVDYWLQPARYPLPEYYDPAEEYYPTYMGVYQLRPGGHLPVLKKNWKQAMDSGLLRTFFASSAKKLIREKGRVTGVFVRTHEGEVIRASAKKGVILATGDYSGDQEMLYYYAPQTRNCRRIYSSRDLDGNYANTGDGHRMGVWAGAEMEQGPHAYAAHSMGGPLGITAFLQLDRFGARFMNEDVGGMELENKIERLPGQFSWQFFDSAWPEQTPWFTPIHGTVSHCFDKEDQRSGRVNRTLNKMDGYTSIEDVERAAGKGDLLKADTLEELVKLAGLPEETAFASIHRYNELCHAGTDEDFGKAPHHLFALTKPPYYACKITPAPMLVTVSGLMSDHKAHALDKEGMPIPGLYLAGNVQGNRFGGEDPSMFPGTSHTMAITYGRQAARSAWTEN